MDRKITSLTIRPTPFSYIVIFLTTILTVLIGSESPQPGSSTQDQNEKQFLHDGPYVFWIGDSVQVP